MVTFPPILQMWKLRPRGLSYSPNVTQPILETRLCNCPPPTLGPVMRSWGHSPGQRQSWVRTPRPVLLSFCCQPQQVEGAITSGPVPQGLGS